MSEDLRPFGDPGSNRFRVDAYPFYLLNRAASRYNVVIESQLRPIGIDIPTWRVLMILGEREPLPIAHVAKSAVINISTMMRIVERMVKAGLIVTQPSETDGRVTELAMTDLGQEKLVAARAATSPVYQQIITGFSAEDFAQLLDLLGRLHDNLD
ncbi:MarR family winged helix-turn-helix transcriptional regulator [Novosphingobium rosa]|uniref:MarR family winged helix-turn-helix transcriptional regulator n=1 Tax=Novosphingobium rosa TaxID=76978 RepID=UPI00082D781D|nr:MarR family transcriptional regulator [Novosphingobium rosa]